MFFNSFGKQNIFHIENDRFSKNEIIYETLLRKIARLHIVMHYRLDSRVKLQEKLHHINPLNNKNEIKKACFINAGLLYAN